MARYVKDLVLNKPNDFVSFMMNDFLNKNQFSMADWKGEPAYRAGDAMIEGYKYLKWSYADGKLHVEAWLKGNLGKEMGLDGFVGCLQKKPYRESLEALFVAMQQDIDIPEGADPSQMAPGSIPVQTVDNTSAATMALVFGILAFITGFISPIICILFGVLGFNRARMGSGSSKAGVAKVGKILCIVGMVITCILWVLNLVLAFI